MPLYEYRCDSCGQVFEIIQKFSDEPLSVHAGCGGRVERLISPPGLQFKGSGWYITDYARASKGKGDSNGDGSKSAAKESKSEVKSEKSPSTSEKSA